MAEKQVVICPYCGAAQTAGRRCGGCGVDFDPLTRREIQNGMGPWFVRDAEHPFRGGMAYERLVEMIDDGEITRYTVVRGPTTSQLWTVVRKIPGLAHLLGDCHECNAKVEPAATRCSQCRTVFGAWLDRNHLGLPDIQALPGDPDGHDHEVVDHPLQSHELPGYRPSASEGVSAFLHHDEVASPPSDDRMRETDDDHSVPEEVDEFEGERMISNALRTELALARRRASNLLLVTIISVVMAIATFVVAMMTRAEVPSVEAPAPEEPTVVAPDPEGAASVVADPEDQGKESDASP